MNRSLQTPSTRIMLVDTNDVRIGWIEKNLSQLGYDICATLSDPSRVLKDISEHTPDLVIIDVESPGRDLIESLNLVAQHAPTPIVLFTSEEDPSYISQAVAAGVCTYQVGNIDLIRVRPLIDAALAQFERCQCLQNALDETRSELADRRVIERAKFMVMQQLECSEQEAFAHMRAEAMNTGVRLNELAAKLLAHLESTSRAPN